MEQQISVRIPDDLAKRLARTAKLTRRKRSEIMRLALEQYLDSELHIKPIDRVRDLLGKYESGVPDLGQRHREYLRARLKRER